MKQSARHLLASAVALVAALSVVLGFSAPAEAASRSTCTSPTISGSVKPGSSPTGGHALTLAAHGTSTTTCPSNYRWTLTLESYSTGPVSVTSSTTFQYRGQSGVTILFPSRTFEAPTGPGKMILTVRTQVNTIGFWYTTATQEYFLAVPTSGFSTTSLPDNPGSSCTVGGPGDPIYSQKGWC